MTKAQLQERAHKLNSCMTMALGVLEAISESTSDPRLSGLCASAVEVMKEHAGAAWIDGEKA